MAQVSYSISLPYGGKDDEYVLSSIVETGFGGDAVNFVCKGTLEYCKLIRSQLELSTHVEKG